MKCYKNYLFDLYGTLIDVHTNERKMYLWKKASMILSREGADFSASELKNLYYRKEALLREKKTAELSKKYGEAIPSSHVEVRFEEIMKLCLAEKNISFSDSQMKLFAETFRVISTEKLKLYDGVIENLRQLKKNGKNIYLMSNAQKLFTEPEVRCLGLDLEMDDFFYSSDYEIKKPDEHFYELPFLKYGLKKEETVMVGNEWAADILGANRFGIGAVYINTLNQKIGEMEEAKDVTEIAEIGLIADLEK